MLYIVRVFEDGAIFEYEYGCIEHAKEHLSFERSSAKVFEYNHGKETEIKVEGK